MAPVEMIPHLCMYSEEINETLLDYVYEQILVHVELYVIAKHMEANGQEFDLNEMLN